jgi:hypothetical protein
MREMAEVVRKSKMLGQDAVLDIAEALGVSIEITQAGARCGSRRLFSFNQMFHDMNRVPPITRDERPGPFDHIHDAGFQ